MSVNLANSFTKFSSFVVEIVSDPEQNYLSLITVIVLLPLQSGILTFLKKLFLCFIILAGGSRMTQVGMVRAVFSFLMFFLGRFNVGYAG